MPEKSEPASGVETRGPRAGKEEKGEERRGICG
jgi:hypothetical protein